MLYLLFLYASLADPNFDVRERATSELARLIESKPWIYGPRLMSLAASSTEPEVAFRVRRPLQSYVHWRSLQYVPSTVPVWPICDATFVPMFLGDVRCRNIGMEWIGPRIQHDPPYWTSYRKATERMIRRSLRNGATPESCDIALYRMWEVEKKCRGDCGASFSKAEEWKGWMGYPKPNQAVK